MSTPTRPVGAAPVATDWGQKVHDIAFAPPGSGATTGTTGSIATTLLKLPLTAGGNVNAGDILIPAGGEGIYLLIAQVNVSVLGGATNWRVQIYKNGVSTWTSNYFKIDSAGGGAMVCALAGLAAGDRLAIYTSGGGGTSGASASGYLHAIKLSETMS